MIAVCGVALLVLGILPSHVIDVTLAAFGADAVAVVAP